VLLDTVVQGRSKVTIEAFPEGQGLLPTEDFLNEGVPC